jgi:hypothetical protein
VKLENRTYNVRVARGTGKDIVISVHLKCNNHIAFAIAVVAIPELCDTNVQNAVRVPYRGDIENLEQRKQTTSVRGKLPFCNLEHEKRGKRPCVFSCNNESFHLNIALLNIQNYQAVRM